jgi:hypothetical protein
MLITPNRIILIHKINIGINIIFLFWPGNLSVSQKIFRNKQIKSPTINQPMKLDAGIPLVFQIQNLFTVEAKGSNKKSIPTANIEERNTAKYFLELFLNK